MTNSYFDNHLFLQHPDKVALPYDANRKRYPNAPITNPIYSTGLLWTTPSDLSKLMIDDRTIDAVVCQTHQNDRIGK